MGGIKILSGGQRACQGAAREASQELSVTALPAGQGPHQHRSWSHSSQARRAEQGQSRGHSPRTAGQGREDGVGLNPGWDVSPGVVVRVRNGEVGGSGVPGTYLRQDQG